MAANSIVRRVSSNSVGNQHVHDLSARYPGRQFPGQMTNLPKRCLLLNTDHAALPIKNALKRIVIINMMNSFLFNVIPKKIL